MVAVVTDGLGYSSELPLPMMALRLQPILVSIVAVRWIASFGKKTFVYGRDTMLQMKWNMTETLVSREERARAEC